MRGGASHPLHGVCDARFTPVRDALAANLQDEIGAAVVVRVGGEVVVDLCAGWADAARTRPWTADTVVDVFSVGKAFVALTVLSLGLDLDAPRMAGRDAAPGAGPPGRASGGARRRAAGCDLRLGLDGARARVPGAVVGAGDRARLPRQHVRLPLRRDRAARHGRARCASASPGWPATRRA